MRFSMFVAIVLLWSLSLGAQILNPSKVKVEYNLSGSPDDIKGEYFLNVNGQNLKVPTPRSESFGRSSLGLQQQEVGSPVPINCGKYYLRHSVNKGYSCERIGHFPWFAAGEDVNGWWRTEITSHAGFNTEKEAVTFSVYTNNMDGKSGRVWGGDELFQTTMSGSTSPLRSGGGGTIMFFGNAGCDTTPTGVSCGQRPGIATGSVQVSLQGTSEKILDEFTTQLTFIYTRNDGTVTWQVAVPVVWREGESNTWTAPIVETPLEVKGRTLPANNTSFAVVNLCDKPQRVRVGLHAFTGEEIAFFNTPELVAGVVMWQIPNVKLPGGVYANVISNIFGNVIRVGLLAPFVRVEEHRPFRGTLRFKGSVEGCTIASLVLGALGDSITSHIAHPER